MNNNNIVLQEVIEFLSKIPPFQFLDEKTLRTICKDVSMEYYPKGTTILHQGGPMSEYLKVIKKGAVKISVGFVGVDEVIIDYRSDGELIGYLAVFGAQRSRANVIAVEDTICYLLELDLIKSLLNTHPHIREFFQESFLNIFLDKAYEKIYKSSVPYSVGGNIFYTTPIGEFAAKNVITANQDVSIQSAASIMAANRISSLVLVDSNNMPVGIVTDRDLRDKVVAKGRDVNEPIKNIMNPPLIRADVKEFGFEVLLKMLRHNVHHILVVKDGKLAGMVTNHDLMLLQGTSPIAIAKDIENQQTIDGLVVLSRGVDSIIGKFLNENVKASNIGRVISEINDRMLKKILEIAEHKFGPPPVPYCWIVYGSEGRREQTFKTDQDNAIIYADPESESYHEEIKKYFSELALFVRDSLVRCGFPLCPADYMATNPNWCQPLNVWKKYFARWISVPTADAVLKSVIFLDFRAVYGDFSLAESLRDHIFYLLRGRKDFLHFIAKMALENSPPIGFFKTLVVEKSGEHKNQLDLKTKGIALIVDIARVLALEMRVRETSTLERLDAVKDKVQIVKQHGSELEHAFEFIMFLRMRHQYEQIKEGLSPDNFIYPDNLSNLEKRTIKEAFNVISKVQELVRIRYNIFVI